MLVSENPTNHTDTNEERSSNTTAQQFSPDLHHAFGDLNMQMDEGDILPFPDLTEEEREKFRTKVICKVFSEILPKPSSLERDLKEL